MNDTEQQAATLAIAKWDGWLYYGSENVNDKLPFWSDDGGTSYCCFSMNKPNYFNSLDAIQSAVIRLDSVDYLHEKRSYISNLMKLVGISPDMQGKWSFIQDFALSNATAAQRAEALYEVIKENK